MEARAGPEEQARRYQRERQAMGQTIRRLRLGLAMKQAELAQGVGYTQPTISRIERGLMTIDNRRLSAIAAYLGVHPSVLWLPPPEAPDG